MSKKYSDSYKYKILEVAEEKIKNEDVTSLSNFAKRQYDYKKEIAPDGEFKQIPYPTLNRWAKKEKPSLIGEPVADRNKEDDKKEDKKEDRKSVV